MINALNHDFGDDVRQFFWDDAPSRLRDAFTLTESGEETSLDVIYEHDKFDKPIACSTDLWEDIEKVADLDSRERPVSRVGEETSRILLTARDGVFVRAFTLGLSCLLVSSIEDVPKTEMIGRKIVLDPSLSLSTDALYKIQDEIEGVWTCPEDEDFEQLLTLLSDGLHTTEVLGRPEIQPIDRVSAHPNRGGPVFVEEEGLLCKLDFKKDEEPETVPLLNCVPRPVDRLQENGELFFTVQLEQQGHTSEPFELKAEAKASYQKLMERIKRVGSSLPKPPAHLGGRQRTLQTGIDQVVHAQWPDQVPPARRSDHWGRIEPDSEKDPIWLFEEHVWTKDRGLQSIRRDEVQVSNQRFKATPSIDEPGPQVEADSEATLRDVEDVIAPAHGSLLAKLLSSHIALCAANVLPTAYDEPHYPLVLVGPKGSGKSTAAELAVACFGRHQSEGLTSIATSTEAGLLAELGGYHSLPVGLDEYRNDSVSHDTNAMLRQTYDKGGTLKGTPRKNENVNHLFRAIPILVGEHMPDDRTGALLDRSLVLQFDNQFGEDTFDETRELIEQAPGIAPKLYDRFADRGDDAYVRTRDKWKQCIKETLEAMGHDGTGRRIRLYANLLAARELVFEDAEKLADDFIDHLIESFDLVDDFAMHRVFFQKLLAYASYKKHRFKDIARVFNGTDLRLAATPVFDTFQEKLNRQRIDAQVNQRDLLNHLQSFKHTWFADWNKSTRFPEFDNPKKAWVIDLNHSDVPEDAIDLAAHAAGELDDDLRPEAADDK